VLVAAVVIGVALLSRGTSGSGLIGSPEAGRSKPSVSTTASSTVPQPPLVTPTPSGTTTPPGSTHPIGEVKVIVVNATGGQAGVGSKNDEVVKAAGYATLPVSNAPASPVTTVYFAEGFEADANAVKLAVKLEAAPVTLKPTEPVVPAAGEANVVVVLGQDYKG
jgi:hypothetical protein